MAEMDDGSQSGFGFDGTEGGKNGKSSNPPPQVFPMGTPQSRYAQPPQPQPAPPYSQQDNAMHAGYGPDPTYPGMQYQLPSHPGPQPVTQQPVPMQNNTTVVIQQAPAVQVISPRVWSSEMCSCCADMGVCLAVTFCGECYGCCCFMERVNESCCFPCCFPGAWMGAVRAKIRTKYNIEGSMMDDFCMTSGPCACCTRYCVFCQMVREVKMMESLGNPM